ncbi:hypothetical protein [Oceanobacillus oncorhynchi]
MDRFAFRRPGPAITRPIENICTSESGVVVRSRATHNLDAYKGIPAL